MGSREQSSTEQEHEPPRIARGTLSVHRDPHDEQAHWGAVDERGLPEHAAAHGAAPPRRKTDDGPCGGDRYRRVSNRRACMPYGATDLNVREEERDCPDLLNAYRDSLRRRPGLADVDTVKALTARIFGAIDEVLLCGEIGIVGRGQLPKRKERESIDRLIREWAVAPGGFAILHKAFARWADSQMAHVVLNSNVCDRDARRRRAGGPRPSFGSMASVLRAAAHGSALIGVGSMDFDRLRDENKGRTRATWGGANGPTSRPSCRGKNEIFCQPSRASSGGTKSLGAVEREVDAAKGLRGLELSGADIQGLMDVADRQPLEDRILSYRADLAGWTWKLDQKAVEKKGLVEARRLAMRADAAEIRKATAGISDQQIRKAISVAKARVERHLRKLPLAGAMALRQGRAELVVDPGQLLGLIPARNDRPKRERQGRILPSYFTEAKGS